MRKKSILVFSMALTRANFANILTFSRVLLAVPIFYFIISSRFDLSLILYLLALFSDLADGYIARKTKSCSPKGAFFDVSADFLLVLSGISGYVILGKINAWILVLLFLMFGQFITGYGGEIVYDPFGKLFGVFVLCSLPPIMIGSNLALLMVNYFTFYLGLCAFVGRVIYLTLILGVNLS